MKLARALMLACVALAAPVLAQDRTEVATVSSMKGSVLVNQGSQFVPVTAGDKLAAGDRVMVPSNGSAEIVFGDGCKLPVKPGTMVTVPRTSTCAGGIAAVQDTEPGGAGALGGTSSDALPLTAFIVAAAASTYVIVHNENASSLRPISP